METPMSVCSMDTDQLKRDIMSHRYEVGIARSPGLGSVWMPNKVNVAM